MSTSTITPSEEIFRIEHSRREPRWWIAPASNGPLRSATKASSGHGSRSPTTKVVKEDSSAIPISRHVSGRAWPALPNKSLTSRLKNQFGEDERPAEAGRPAPHSLVALHFVVVPLVLSSATTLSLPSAPTV